MSQVAHHGGLPRPGLPAIAEVARAERVAALRLLRDRALVESIVLLLPIALVGATHAVGPTLWLVSAAYLVANAWLALRTMRAARARAPILPWRVARGLLSVVMVCAGQVLTAAGGVLAVVYLPVVGLAAFGGRLLVLVVGAASIVAQATADAVVRGSMWEALERTVGFAAVVGIVALGTRWEVRRMHRARERLRRAVTADRRRARQLGGVEAIGRLLASIGPTAESLDQVVGRVATEFGFARVSIYLGDATWVRLGAQRGYRNPVETFDGSRGVVGRVMQTRRPALVPDVSLDPDYVAVDSDVRSEICAPLLAEGEFLGFINVESSSEHQLDSTDLRVLVAVADRVAAALIIGRERQRLSERVDLFRHLHEFSEAINSTLEPDALYATIVRSVASVVPADIAALVILERASGRYFLRAIEGYGGVEAGTEVRPGEGMAGRAIRDRALIIDEQFGPAQHPASVADLGGPSSPTMRAASVPLVRDRAVVGALTLLRPQSRPAFSELDRDALAMIAEQAALAVANAFLHAEVADLAVRDPLTGLFNRRYLDPALEQLFARRSRQPASDRPALAAIMFDLDHFSDLNNRYGHQVGDEVLRGFGGVLRARMRATDLVARYGGEEFAAILYEATLDDAVRIAEEVRLQLAARPFVAPSGEPLHATVSAGCAAVGPDVDTADALLRAADVALYMAKRAGRDRVVAA